MSILNLTISLGILFGVAKGIQLFTRHCRGRFGRSFFTARGFWLAAIAINSLWWGYYFWVTTRGHLVDLSSRQWALPLLRR